MRELASVIVALMFSTAVLAQTSIYRRPYPDEHVPPIRTDDEREQRFSALSGRQPGSRRRRDQ
jgi:hypothetical protein